jgi:hypothetical protein
MFEDEFDTVIYAIGREAATANLGKHYQKKI